MKNKKTIRIIIASCIVLAVLIVTIPIVSCLNTKIADYPYSRELPTPGVGVDIKNDGFAMRAFIAWNRFYNNIASSLWSAPEGITKTKLRITARDGVEIGGYILEPAGSESETLMTMLYCHGGAFFMPILPSSMNCAAFYAKELNCRIFMPEYRLTPANPYPTPVNDCYDTLKYLVGYEHTDTRKVIIYGESAGGDLAAEVMHMCRDEELLEPMAHMLIYPVTDCAQQYESLTEYEHATWSREANLIMWKLYLDDRDAAELPYAVPMLMENFENFPPVYIEPSEMDTLRDQAIAYAEKMREHGVDVTENIVEGAYHGFDMNMGSDLVKRTLETRVNWLKNIEKESEVIK